MSSIKLLSSILIEVPPCITTHQGATTAFAKPLLVVMNIEQCLARTLQLIEREHGEAIAK
jgi:hypothetical protein